MEKGIRRLHMLSLGTLLKLHTPRQPSEPGRGRIRVGHSNERGNNTGDTVEHMVVKFNKAWDELIQEEARIANDLQRDRPEMTRTEALQIAREIMNRQRIGY
jgi:hypothetical protein